MIECYSLITILSIIAGGVASLALWYWSGRRPPKKTWKIKAEVELLKQKRYNETKEKLCY